MDKRQKIKEAARMIQLASDLLHGVIGELDAIEDFASYKRANLRVIVPKKGDKK